MRPTGNWSPARLERDLAWKGRKAQYRNWPRDQLGSRRDETRTIEQQTGYKEANRIDYLRLGLASFATSGHLSGVEELNGLNKNSSFLLRESQKEWKFGGAAVQSKFLRKAARWANEKSDQSRCSVKESWKWFCYQVHASIFAIMIAHNMERRLMVCFDRSLCHTNSLQCYSCKWSPKTFGKNSPVSGGRVKAKTAHLRGR